MTNYIEAGKLQYKPAEIAGVRIVIWKTKTARKKEKNRPAEDTRVLGALGVVFQKNRKVTPGLLYLTQKTDILNARHKHVEISS